MTGNGGVLFEAVHGHLGPARGGCALRFCDVDSKDANEHPGHGRGDEFAMLPPRVDGFEGPRS
jgi:hypothetical protein